MEGQLNKTMRAGPRLLVLTVVAGILFMVPVVTAGEPDWNYSSPGVEIGGLAVSPKGDLIVAGAEKVLFFSKNGTLLAKEPFGNEIVMTRDGKYTASVYYSTVYFFTNPVPGGSEGAVRLGEYEISDGVQSIDISRGGTIIAGQTRGKSLFVINTGTGIVRGNTKAIDSVIKVSPAGGRIIGISDTALHSYSTTGTLSRTNKLEINSAPHTVLLSSTGNTAIFNDGQKIRSLNTNTAKERWNRQVTGFVTSLSMTPDGSLIVAGTETGTIAGVDENGNMSWSYSSNPESRANAGITCTAVSDKGAITAAGTADGKIMFLNSRGELSGSFQVRYYIRHIAMSTDGSLVVAASDDRMYAFSPLSFPAVPSPSPSPGGTVVKNATPPSPVQTTSLQEHLTTPPAEIPATYSVIRTATRSPPALVTLLLSLALVVVIAGRKR